MDRKQIKSAARAALGNKYFSSEWGTAILLCLLGTVLMSILPGIGTFIVMGPISYGLAKAFLNSARGGGKVDINTLFDGFRDDFAGTFLISLLTGIFVSLWSMLFLIPGIIAALKYSMAYYIKIDNPSMSAMECIKASKEMMKGHCGEYFVLFLSFIGFAIVGALCLGLGGLWLTPYMSMSQAFFYLKIKGEDAQTAAPGYNYYAPVQE